MLYIGADHAGFALKEYLKTILDRKKIPYTDCGAFTYAHTDDYPDIAFCVAKEVVKDLGSKGLILCSTGTGMAMAANRVKGARAMMCQTVACARLTREHNDANILTFGPLTITRQHAVRVLDAFLKSPADASPRRRRRSRKMDAIRL